MNFEVISPSELQILPIENLPQADIAFVKYQGKYWVIPPSHLKGDKGDQGIQGIQGDRGTDSFVYIAYASDSNGSDFSLIPNQTLKFRAEIHSNIEIPSPVAGDFAGKWIQYIFHVDNDYDLPLIGVLDGVNDTFDLLRSFIPGTVQVWNGPLKMKRGIHFNDNTGQVVFTANYIPQSYDDLSANVIADENTITGETPTGLIDGVNKIFTLSKTPVEKTVCGYWNGAKQKRGVNYTISGDQIEFIEAPEIGAILDFDYKY